MSRSARPVALLAVVVRPVGLSKSTVTYVGAGVMFAIASRLLSGVHVAGCWHDGIEVMKQAILCIILTLSGQLPFRRSDCLDCTGRLSIIQHVDGGYMFLHRLLLEYSTETKQNEELP